MRRKTRSLAACRPSREKCQFTDGPPVLMLHGFPQNLAMWAKVAPTIASQFTVVCADLRGYGDSSKPKCSPDRSNYSFRTMAADQVAVMKRLGFERFQVIGHDRGGRTGHRMALDWPDAVASLAVLDIVPTKNSSRRGGPPRWSKQRLCGCAAKWNRRARGTFSKRSKVS
jgi:pimeloyl-ACP methyl ester carboxylesterase